MAKKSAENINKTLTFIEDDDDGYDLDDLLRSEAEVMGKDTFGTSYRAEMETGKSLIVRRLKETCLSHEEFDRRIQEIVKLTSHKNVHPLRAYYFSRDEKLLLFDYMAMGSLNSLLHSKNISSWNMNYMIHLHFPSIICFFLGYEREIKI